jgi:peptide/nickel transport system permease protein
VSTEELELGTSEAMEATFRGRPESLTSLAVRAMLRHRSGMAGLTMTLLVVVGALLAPMLAPYGELEMHPADRFQGPSAAYLLGTDEFGRDILSRILMGSRISLSVGMVSVSIASVVGVTVGLVAGLYVS